MNKQHDKHDEAQDQQVEQSFPASDPPSTTPTKGPGRTKAGAAQDESHQPKGTPTDDRLASETASAKIQGVHPPQTDHR